MAYYGQKKLRLGEILVAADVLTEDKLEEALANKGSMKIGEYLVENNIVTEEQIANALSEKLGYKLIELQNVQIEEDILKLAESKVLKKNRVIPVAFAEGNMNILQLAMADPTDINAIDDLAIITGYQIEPLVSTPRAVMLALDRFYGSDEMQERLEAYAKEKFLNTEVDENEEEINNSPIVSLVKEMIDKAARQRASDIHIEALEKEVRVRYRIDGALYERARYNIKVLPAIVARVKIIGGMDISEKRKPQDGRITQIVDRVEYDIRVSVLPSVYGEKIVMRLAAKKALNREKSQLGLKPGEMKQFDHILKNPHGILLVTGPTGSGKSTTLYTALSELNKEDVNIITVEDPVEANIDGINQVQVNPKANLTFATALRSILRQDPDIIMIGEIRDQETAGIAVQASITGHLVVSTLHTNSSASTITRLEDMGVESYLIADSVIGVIAQRLVRRLCPECKIARPATEEECDILGVDSASKHIIYEPRIKDPNHVCTKCDGMGYRGRIGVYEIMEMTPKLKTLISRGGNADEIKEVALSEGMHTLRMSAAEYVLDGTTSFSEMMKVSFDS
ncbi:MAG: Flp pilus assembly complex ATPase component TadA [Lachnospiraceae bacterium]|nr:Flp pilus assembly complex ATPase component TadA [Lachnospiraceae bacterium]